MNSLPFVYNFSGHLDVSPSLALRYGDWKIAERLQDDGACPRLRRGDQPDSVHDGITLGLAFAEDMKGRMRPGLRAVQQLSPICYWLAMTARPTQPSHLSCQSTCVSFIDGSQYFAPAIPPKGLF